MSPTIFASVEAWVFAVGLFAVILWLYWALDDGDDGRNA